MPYKSLQCKRDAKHQFYAAEGDVHKNECPQCGGIIVCRRIVKHKPTRRGGNERYEVSHINSSLLTRPSREKARKTQEEHTKLARQEEINFRRQLAMSDSKFASEPDSDSAFDDESVTELGEDDLPYLPGETFKPSMRFTQSSGLRFAAGQRDLTPLVFNPAYTKIMSDTVKNSAVRGNTNGKMGQSAHQASQRGVQRVQGAAFRGDHEEWNHLIADCLGGPTEQHNLVAASAACNSYMLNIEACLRGKSHITVVVTAFCNIEHVAEWIEYKIINKGKTLIKIIDAQNHYFTKDDGKDLRTEVLKLCKQG